MFNCSFEKLNFNIYSAVLLNHVGCFNKICRICCLHISNSHRLAQIHATFAEIQNIFKGIVFSSAHCRCKENWPSVGSEWLTLAGCRWPGWYGCCCCWRRHRCWCWGIEHIVIAVMHDCSCLYQWPAFTPCTNTDITCPASSHTMCLRYLYYLLPVPTHMRNHHSTCNLLPAAIILQPWLHSESISKPIQSKVKQPDVALHNMPHHYENSCAIWDRTVLPATWQRWHSRL